MADDLTGGGSDGTSSESFDIGSILGATSGSSPETSPTGGQPNANEGGDPAAQQSSQYKFGGRSYATQKAAEEAHNKLYGKFSEQQSLLNQMKEALKNPALMAKFRGDQSMETILSKLGVEEAEAAAEAEAEANPQNGGVPQGMEQYVHEWNTERATHQLEREEWAFERQLGRAIDPKERRSVMDLISRHDSLTYAEAWKLAFHDKMLKDAATRRQAPQGQVGGRQLPKALNVPGIKIDTKKPIEAQSNEEFRESLREELRAHSGGRR